MDFAGMVRRIKLNSGADDEELRRAMCVTADEFSRFLSGEESPPHDALQTLFSKYSVSAGKAMVDEPLPVEPVDMSDIRREICSEGHFCVVVETDSLAGFGFRRGDIAIIDQNGAPNRHDIVLASIDGGEGGLYEYTDFDDVLQLGELALFRPDFEKRVKLLGRLVGAIHSFE